MRAAPHRTRHTRTLTCTATGPLRSASATPAHTRLVTERLLNAGTLCDGIGGGAAVWPEGLGINRGVLHVLDCADLVQGYAALRQTYPPGLLSASAEAVPTRGASRARADATAAASAMEALLQRRESLFGYTKRVSGHNRLTELKAFEASDGASKRYCYTTDPHSRYTRLPPSLPPRPAASSAEIEEEAEVSFRI